MTWTGALIGIGVAAVLLVPLALKWQLPLRVVGAWIVVVGAVSGAAWAAVLGQGRSRGLAARSGRHGRRVERRRGRRRVLQGSRARLPRRRPARSSRPPTEPFSTCGDSARGRHRPSRSEGRPLEVRELANVEVGEAGHLIGIGMHLLNVHVNRAPVGGSRRSRSCTRPAASSRSSARRQRR